MLQCDNLQCVHLIAPELPGICACFTKKPPVDENGQCTEFYPKKVRKVYDFNIGDKVRVLLLGDWEGKVGEVIGKELRKPGLYRYWVRFMIPHNPDISKVLDYYGDEIEPA
ncbi:MAG: hypothetical protein H0Z24_03140 [Thermosipho sp. (in: Bacteria)]|nr:hypothetical protein [Thermosipho sp. (in: thermotogales)]